MRKIVRSLSVLLPVVAFLTGCATSGDLERVRTQQDLINAKADKALQEAEAAKVSADAATARADEATKRAEERERAAAEKVKKADATFQQSMKK